MNEQLSFNATIEIDQAQSMKNIKKVVDDIGKSTAVEIKGFNIDPNTLSKQLQSAMKQTFNFNKDTGLNSLTSVIKGAYGEILTVQQSVDEHGKTIIENAKLTTDALKAQKARYEEIRVLYEKLGKLQLDNMTASQKNKETIASEIKETQKLIRQKEKALKADESMINVSLQENMIDKQKLKNSIAIAKEEDKITKRKESAYARLQKAWELIHKYEMQSVGANEKDLEVLNRKKEVAKTMQRSIQGTISKTGLSDEKLKKQVDNLKEIQALELKATKHAHEEKTLNAELVALDNKRLATKKQLEMATVGTKEHTALEKQLEQQALAVLQKKAQIDEKGVANQKVLNTLAQKELELQNQLEVSKAKQEDAREREEKAVERLIAKTQKSMGIDLDNLLARKSDYMTTKDKQSIEEIRTKLNELNGTSLKDVKNQIADLKLELKEVNSAISNTEFKQATSLVDELGNGFKRLTDYVVGTMVVDKLWDVFREGIVYLKELDDAYADVAISMSITREEFDGWISDARKIAQANGVMTTSVMDMVKIYATSGENISQIQDKLAGTAMIQNITQWDAEKTTSVVNSIINQYKLLDKEINGTTGSVSGAIEYMGDALIGVSNALKVDNVTGIQEIASAIDAAGGIMEQAGASMEWYMGVTGTLNETMNATGSEIGNAMKMISARVFAQAQAMEELGESAENIPVEMRKAEKALTSVGVSIRDASDPSKLRDLEEIMDELAGKWQNLSDATKNFVAEGVAGTNRRNY